jgi:hypothetical protein
MMATAKQSKAARQNVGKAQKAAASKELYSATETGGGTSRRREYLETYYGQLYFGHAYFAGWGNA